MNKKVYLVILTVITVFCIIFGTAFHFFGWISGDLLGNYISSGQSDSNTERNEIGQGRISYSEKHDAFTAIRIDASVLEINIKTGDDYHVTYDSVSYLTPQIRTKDSVLIIEQPSVFKLNTNNNQCELTITVPSDITLQNLDVQADVGNIHFTDIKSGKTALQADVGNIEADNCSFSYINAEADVGAIQFDGCVLEKGELSADVGAITLDDCTFTDLELSGDLGDITVRTPLDLSDYSMELSVEVGKLKVNGTTFKRSYNQRGSEMKHLEIENELGNVEVEYTK